MKKLISIALCTVLVFNLIPLSYASDNTYTKITELTQNPYNVGTDSTAQISNVLSVALSEFVIYKLPLPGVYEGASIENYVFTQYTGIGGGEMNGRYFKLPYIEDHNLSSLKLSDALFADKLSITGTPDPSLLAPDSVKTTVLDFTLEYGNGYAALKNEIDITSYVRQWTADYPDAGYILLGYNTRWTSRVYPLSYGAFNSHGCRAFCSYTMSGISEEDYYEYPDINSETFASDLQKTVDGGHPYLYANKDDFERIREFAFGKNEYLTKMYGGVKAKATTYLSKPVSGLSQVINNTGYNTRGEECREIVTNCAFVYAVEGDEAYAERAWAEAKAWAELYSWGTYQYIDNNQPVQALSLCYDWMYEWLGDSRRNMLIDALKDKHFDAMYDMAHNIDAYKNTSGFHGWYFNFSNHTVLDNTATFVSAIAIADTDTDYSADIMEFTFRNMRKVIEKWYPDSAWYEGLGYWAYTGPYMAKWIMAMDKALGTNYGISDIRCVKNIVTYPIYSSSATTNFVVNDTGYESALYPLTECLYPLAVINGDVSIEKYALDTAMTDDPLSCIMLRTDIDYEAVDKAEFDKDKFFRNTDMVTMRNTWSSAQQTFGGMFVQDAGLTHGVMNSGTFTFEALGHMWVTNPGRDSYSLEGYWDSSQNGKRWSYYFSRAEANSCMVIGPDEGGGQNVLPGDKIDKYMSSPGRAFAIADLTKTYAPKAVSYRRGVELCDNRTVFAVQDEVELTREREVYSFYNIHDCDYEILPDGKTVILSVGNRHVRVSFECDEDFELSITDCTPLPTSPNPDGNKKIDNMKRIAVHFDNISKFSLRAEFEPYLTEEELSDGEDAVVPLSRWSAEEEEKPIPTAENILADGEALDGFNPFTRCYKVYELPKRIDVAADESKYEILCKTESDKGVARVILKDKENGNINSYIIEACEDESLTPLSIDECEAMKYKMRYEPGAATEAHPLGENQPWQIESEGAEQFDNIGVVSPISGVVFRLKLPPLCEELSLDRYVFRVTTRQYFGDDLRIAHMDGIDESQIPMLSTSSPEIADRLASWTDYNISDASVMTKDVAGWKYNYIDISKYARKCQRENKEYFYVFVHCKWTSNICGSVTDENLKNYDLYPYSLCSESNAPPFSMISSSHTDNESYSSNTDVSFEFTNKIKSVSAVLNGQTVPCSHTDKKVRVNAVLSSFSNQTLMLDVTDIYGQTVSTSLNFSTGYTKYETTSAKRDAEAYHITKNYVPALMTSRKSVRYLSSHMVLYRIPTASFADGKIPVDFKLSYTTYGDTSDSVLLKLPGDDWNTKTLRYDDAGLSKITDDWIKNGKNSQYIASSSQSSESHGASKLVRHTDDITAYAAECIESGEEYIDIGIVSPSVLQVFGFNTASEEYAPYRAQYSYVRSVDIAGSGEVFAAMPKIVDADSDDGYTDAETVSEITENMKLKALTVIGNADCRKHSFYVVIASYDDNGVMRDVSLNRVTADGGDCAREADSGVIECCGSVKAFVWDARGCVPVRGF